MAAIDMRVWMLRCRPPKLPFELCSFPALRSTLTTFPRTRDIFNSNCTKSLLNGKLHVMPSIYMQYERVIVFQSYRRVPNA